MGLGSGSMDEPPMADAKSVVLRTRPSAAWRQRVAGAPGATLGWYATRRREESRTCYPKESVAERGDHWSNGGPGVQRIS